MASLERGLHGKEAEIEGLKQALQLKDDTIKKLQAELQRMAAELARAEERARQAELEMSRLKVSREHTIFVHCHILSTIIIDYYKFLALF